MKKRITIQDIANYLGIDKSTVSRALAGSPRVKPETLKKVRLACEQLNYIPNQTAKTLASSRSNSLVLLIPSLSNEIFADIVLGAKQQCAAAGYTLLIGDTAYSPLEEESLVRQYLQQNVAGFVLTETTHSDNTLRLLREAELPVIEIMDCSQPANFNQTIGIDNDQAARQVTEYLIKKGRTKIAFCSCFLDNRAAIRRHAWAETLQQHDLPSDRTLTLTGLTSFSNGAESIIEIIRRWPDTDAVVYINDDLAAGAALEATRRGLVVGKDIDLFGFNDLEYARHLIPDISSVRTPRAEMGALAFSNLIQILHGAPLQAQRIKLDYELILRSSA